MIRRYPEGSDVVRDMAEVLGQIERRARRDGLLGEWLIPLVARMIDDLEEIRERENRATEMIAENATGGSEMSMSIGVPEFRPFPKIGRLRRSIIVTEKIDGTNASVYVPEDDGPLIAGSRNRWIYPEADNFGFAAWVRDNADDLRGLGPGLHFGEWWGQGIQRRYDQDRKRFSLFNVDRWADERPACCDVVPVLSRCGEMDTEMVKDAMDRLARNGSSAAPGFMQPEGVIVFHPQSRQSFKWTFEKDDAGKGHGA